MLILAIILEISVRGPRVSLHPAPCSEEIPTPRGDTAKEAEALKPR